MYAVQSYRTGSIIAEKLSYEEAELVIHERGQESPGLLAYRLIPQSHADFYRNGSAN